MRLNSPALYLPRFEIGPEGAVFDAVAGVTRHEHRMMLAGDLRQLVAHGIQEVRIGGDNAAVNVELDDGLRFADRVGLGERVARLRIVAPQSHGGPS